MYADTCIPVYAYTLFHVVILSEHHHHHYRPFKDALMFNVRRLEKEMNSVDVGILVWSLGVCIFIYEYLYNCVYIKMYEIIYVPTYILCTYSYPHTYMNSVDVGILVWILGACIYVYI
jgi:hypothetical protein